MLDKIEINKVTDIVCEEHKISFRHLDLNFELVRRIDHFLVRIDIYIDKTAYHININPIEQTSIAKFWLDIETELSRTGATYRHEIRTVEVMEILKRCGLYDENEDS